MFSKNSSRKYQYFDNHIFDLDITPDTVHFFNCTYDNKSVLLTLKYDHLTLTDKDGVLLHEVQYKVIPMWKRDKKFIDIHIGESYILHLKGDGIKISDKLNIRCQHLSDSRYFESNC